MTTNALDLNLRLLATDSRWSFRTDSMKMRGTAVVAYIDNTGFDKIAVNERGNSAFMFAGQHSLIDQWKQWVTSPSNINEPHPPIGKGFAICAVDMDSGSIEFEHGQRVNDIGCRFAGTGADHAYECWTRNLDVKRSIQSAAAKDPLSGGNVKFFDCASRLNNLYSGVMSTSIASQFLDKGMVMYYNAKATRSIPVSLENAMRTDGDIKDLVAAVRAGSVSAEAPSGLDEVIWTPADISRLDLAIEHMRRKQAGV